MVFVISEEACQVAEFGLGSGSLGTATVAVGAECRSLGEHGIPQLQDIRRLYGLVAPGGVHVFAQLFDVLHRDA